MPMGAGGSVEQKSKESDPAALAVLKNGLPNKKPAVGAVAGSSLKVLQKARSARARLSDAMGPRVDCKLIILGLDNSGKTSLLAKLKPQSRRRESGAPTEVTPTVGYAQDEFVRGPLNLTVFDMAGASRYRELWSQYYREAKVRKCCKHQAKQVPT